NPVHHFGSGVLHAACGDLATSVGLFRNAITLRPDFARAHLHLSLVLLQLGEFREAWAAHEWRLHLPESQRLLKVFSGPRWDGSDLSGKTIVLHGEYGLGDCLQFARFATCLANRGARVIF